MPDFEWVLYGNGKGVAEMLPRDLSDLDSWEGFEQSHTPQDLAELKARIGEIGPEHIRGLVDQNLVSLQFGAGLTSQLVSALENPVTRLEFLQHMISTARDWPDSHGDSFHVEYLELMWESIKIAKTLKLSSEELSDLLSSWLNDSTFLELPVALTAVVSLHPMEEVHSDAIASSFLECWEIGGKSEHSNSFLRDSNDWDIFEESLADLAPLIAVLTLNPSTKASNQEKLMRLTISSGYNDFAVAYWAYICAVLTTDREAGYFDPSAIWHNGFFANGLPKNAPKFDPEGSYRCLLFFWENRNNLDLENYHGEQVTAPGVVNLLVSHPLITPELKKEALLYLEDFDWEPEGNFRTA
jgi:hypothetical protein